MDELEIAEQGRHDDRSRRILLTAASAALAKGISVVTILVTVPLTLDYLGAERYGLWMTISSLVTVLSFADLGLGFGLVNAIADANGKDDPALARRHIAAAFAILGFIALALLSVFFLIYPWAPWASLFSVTASQAAGEVGPAMIALVICFSLSLPVGAVLRIQMGYQLGYIAHLWQFSGNLLSLLAIVICISQEAALPWLVLAMLTPPLLTGTINGIIWFRRRPEIWPAQWNDLSIAAMRNILKLGMLFLVLQVSASLAFASDNIIIAHTIGVESVTGYAITVQLFSVVSLVLGMALQPLWPTYGEALARNDLEWIRSTLRRSLALSIGVSGLAALFLIAFGREILSFWTDQQVSPSAWLIVGCGVWKVLEGTGNSIAMFLNGIHLLRVQVILGLAMALTAVAAKILFAAAIGVEGVVWATVLSYLILGLVPHIWIVPRALASIANRRACNSNGRDPWAQ